MSMDGTKCCPASDVTMASQIASAVTLRRQRSAASITPSIVAASGSARLRSVG